MASGSIRTDYLNPSNISLSAPEDIKADIDEMNKEKKDIRVDKKNKVLA